MTTSSDWPGPFGAIVKFYLQSGWLGVLPLPPRQKDPVPAGFTGWRHYDVDPTMRDIDKWMKSSPDGNVALRMPRNILGIDVDAYDGKPGAESLAEAEAKWGPLPATWRTTSRLGTPSGIRLFQVTEGLKWPNTVGPGIETIHRGHRYIVAPPSIHPQTGDHYMWVTPTGEATWEFPSPSSLPFLPKSWEQGLTGGESRTTATLRSKPLEGAQGWLTPGEPCRAVLAQLARFDSALSAKGSRYDSTRDLSLSILFLGQQGHAGVAAAFDYMKRAYMEAVSRDRGGDLEAEWHRMFSGAFEIVSASPRPIEDCDADRCGIPKPLETPDALKGIEIVPPSQVVAEDDISLEDGVFGSRPELEHIRQSARARLASPWATLGACLVRVVCQIPPTVVLPPIVAGEASVNLFVGMVGRSGSGKQAAEAVAKDAFYYGGDQAEVPLGSGEGIVKSYVTYVAPKGDDPGGPKQVETSVLFRASEIDSLAALKGRSASTIMPAIRDAWNGDQLGFGYAAAEKRLFVAPLSYRMGMIVAIQPDRADALLGEDEADGGTPQRFLWMPATDPHVPDETPEAPEQWHWVKPSTSELFASAGTGRRWVKVPAQVEATIKDAAKSRLRGDDDALDGHALLSRLKVASALAFLAGRYEVTMDDWRIAGLIMLKSDATRREVLLRMSERRAKANKARIAFEKEKTIAVEEAKTNAGRRRLMMSLHRHVGREWTAQSVFRKKLSPTLRGLFDEIVEELLSEGVIERVVEPHPKVPDGVTKYRMRA